MNKLTRKELKTDHFVTDVEHGVEYVTAHRNWFLWGGIAAAAVLLVGLGTYFFLESNKATRQELLGKAYAIQQSPFGPPQQGSTPQYATIAAREAAANKAFAEVVAKYPSSDEGMIAKYFLAASAANQGKWAEAEKSLKDVADSGNKQVASLAKLALAQVFEAQGKAADAEKLLRGLMDNPTDLVSKDQAQLALGRLLLKSNPTEARKLIDPLRAGTSAISRAAISTLGDIK